MFALCFLSIEHSTSEVDNSLFLTVKNTLQVSRVLGNWEPWITHIWYGVIMTLMGSITPNSWFLLSSLLPKEQGKLTLLLLVGGLLLFPLVTQNWWSSCRCGLCQHSALQCAEVFCKAAASLPMLLVSDLLHPSCCLSFLNQNQQKQKRGPSTTFITDGACHCIVFSGWRERKVLALKETQAAELVEPPRQCWIFPSYCDRDCKVKWDTGIRSSVKLYAPLSSLKMCEKLSEHPVLYPNYRLRGIRLALKLFVCNKMEMFCSLPETANVSCDFFPYDLLLSTLIIICAPGMVDIKSLLIVLRGLSGT